MGGSETLCNTVAAFLSWGSIRESSPVENEMSEFAQFFQGWYTDNAFLNVSERS